MARPRSVERDAGMLAALASMGGVRALARALDLDHSTVVRWESVPMKYLLRIEELTGIPREVLRPDIFRAPRPKKRKADIGVTA